MSKTIADYGAANSIDGANDFLLIEPSGNTLYKRISRNVLLGITSQPLGLSDSQSPTNKTFDSTNTYTIKDGSLTLQNTASPTKQATLSLASITAGQTRVITVPDANLTMVGTATTQTLTNKTLTSPTITGGTMDNTTVTVDSISGHTTPTTVTVANLQIANGVLNSANAVTATSIAAGAIQPQALIAGTGSGWSWQSWTPVWVNMVVSSSTVTAKYVQIGKAVVFRIAVVLGGGNAPTGGVTFTLPVTSVSYAGTSTIPLIANAVFYVTNSYSGFAAWATTTTAKLVCLNASATYLTEADISATIPGAFTNGSEIHIEGLYEGA